MPELFFIFTPSIPELSPPLTSQQVDEILDFHESSFQEFPETDGVRNCCDPTSGIEHYISNVSETTGLINVIKLQILELESGLDDLDEDSDDFVILSDELDSCVSILNQLQPK